MPIVKRKEHAQEVETIQVYNKRLRKSFIVSRNVRKPSPTLHGTSNNFSQRASRPPFNDVKIPSLKVNTGPSFTFDASGDLQLGENTDVPLPRKKKSGRVGLFFSFYTSCLRHSIVNRLRMNFSKTGCPWDQPIWKKYWNWRLHQLQIFVRFAIRTSSSFDVAIAFTGLRLALHAVPNHMFISLSIPLMCGMEHVSCHQTSCTLGLLFISGTMVPLAHNTKHRLMAMNSKRIWRMNPIQMGQWLINFKLFTPMECAGGISVIVNAQTLRLDIFSYFVIVYFRLAIRNLRQLSHSKSSVTFILKQWSVRFQQVLFTQNWRGSPPMLFLTLFQWVFISTFCIMLAYSWIYLRIGTES